VNDGLVEVFAFGGAIFILTHSLVGCRVLATMSLLETHD
jgi:hypothetical protein